MPRFRVLRFQFFADNTNLSCSADNLQTLTTNMNNNLNILFDWFCANKLSLNLKKTNYILFHHRTKPVFDVSLYLNGIIINRVPKFLGAWLDEHINWSDHISYVLSKIAKNNGILSKIRFFTDKKIALLLNYTLICPYLSYCDIVWTSNYTSRLNFLHISQKRNI